MSVWGILGRRVECRFDYWIPTHATDTQPSLGNNEPLRHGYSINERKTNWKLSISTGMI